MIFNTLSIEVNETNIAFSVFNGIILKSYGLVKLTHFELLKILFEIEEKITDLIKKHKVTLLVMKQLNMTRNDKEKLYQEGLVRTVIMLACARKNVVFQEYKVDGYFKKLTMGKNTFKKKLKVLNRNGIEIKESSILSEDEKILVDCILLGEGVATGKLQISK
jgi:Holliday junction resolvasome RuvABC endonuclease subunit